MGIRLPLQRVELVSTGTAITATGNSTPTLPFFADIRGGLVELNVTAASGTTPTLDVYLQTSLDGGNTWYDAVHFPQQTTTTAANTSNFMTVSLDDAGRAIGNIGNKTIAANTIGVPLMGGIMRVAYTVGGTTPSFNFYVRVHFPYTDNYA